MKKTMFTVLLVGFSIVTYLQAKEKSVIGFASIQDVETLSTGESGNGHWMEPKTVSCVLELGNGMFTASVERVCELSKTMQNCTGVACGEPF